MAEEEVTPRTEDTPEIVVLPGENWDDAVARHRAAGTLPEGFDDPKEDELTSEEEGEDDEDDDEEEEDDTTAA